MRNRPKESLEDFNQTVGPVSLSYTKFCDTLDHLNKAKAFADHHRANDDLDWLNVYNLIDYAINRLESDYD